MALGGASFSLGMLVHQQDYFGGFVQEACDQIQWQSASCIHIMKKSKHHSL